VAVEQTFIKNKEHYCAGTIIYTRFNLFKGGDLAAEIQESNTRPKMMEIAELFPEAYFKEKYLLYVNR
jgi:16S rRNA (guanine527-N7)-methyltransferase